MRDAETKMNLKQWYHSITISSLTQAINIIDMAKTIWLKKNCTH